MSPPDDINFIHDAIAAVWWDLLYHERELPKAHEMLALAKGVIERGGFGRIVANIENDEEEMDDDKVRTVDDYIRNLILSARGSIKFHEEGLADAHRAMAGVKAFLAAGNYPQINLEEIANEQRKKMHESYPDHEAPKS